MLRGPSLGVAVPGADRYLKDRGSGGCAVHSGRTVKGSPHIFMPASTHEGIANYTETLTGIGSLNHLKISLFVFFMAKRFILFENIKRPVDRWFRKQ